MEKIFLHLKNNNGDAHIENIVLLVMSFTIGALLLVILSRPFQEGGAITRWISKIMGNALSGDKIT